MRPVNSYNVKNLLKNDLPTGLTIGKISDGRNTFNELYELRKYYNDTLFNIWSSLGIHSVHKSNCHNDGELVFGGGWFVVCAELPTGQISNHYQAKDWDLFQIPSTERALLKYDGHSDHDIADRLRNLILGE